MALIYKPNVESSK